MIDLGVKVSDSLIFRHDKIWSRYSNDKVDIGETLVKIYRTLSKAFPLSHSLRALSIGSSNEPQFRILQSAFSGGLYLVDIEKQALEVIQERIVRQNTHNVVTVHHDFHQLFLEEQKSRLFLKKELKGKKIDLITLQHSLYYCVESLWYPLVSFLYKNILAAKGALYAVLMSAHSKDRSTTSWLYNHFAGKFCNHQNNQDLLAFAKQLKKEKLFSKAEMISKTNRIKFFVDDFEQFMSVVWMILLYPNVHPYSLEQRREMTEYMYKNFFVKKKPIYQDQDHLVIYRGLSLKGLL